MNRIVINTLLYFIIISTLIILIFPIVWMLLTAFKSTDEIFKIPPTFLPKNFSFDADVVKTFESKIHPMSPFSILIYINYSLILNKQVIRLL